MSINDSLELSKCPFCGGEAETLTAESMHGGYLFGIMCSDCCSRGDVYETEAEAAAAWNTRHVETCKLNELDALTQTLSMVNGCAWSECSECGCLTPDDSTYCINCGREVEAGSSRFEQVRVEGDA